MLRRFVVLVTFLAPPFPVHALYDLPSTFSILASRIAEFFIYRDYCALGDEILPNCRIFETHFLNILNCVYIQVLGFPIA